MSVEAVSWALNDAPDVPPQCMAVLIGLANHAHANGRGAYPSQERLAHYARKSVRSVQRDLAELERRGLIRRGDQRHVEFLPPDRRPVVWDLAMERRRPIPPALDPFAEPQSGRPAEVPEPVDNRGDAYVGPVADRGDVHVRPGRRTRPNGATRTSYEPSRTVKNHQRERALMGARVVDTAPYPPAERRGAALPPPRDVPRCTRPGHIGQPAGRCAACRSELLEVDR